MANKPRSRGSNILLGLDDYNRLFESYFKASAVSVIGMKKHCDLQLLYYYGLRKMCGLSLRQVSCLLGYSNSYIVSYGLGLCCKKLCLFDVSFDANFAQSWVDFRKYCRLFRVPMTAQERYKKWYKKHSNKKKRK